MKSEELRKRAKARNAKLWAKTYQREAEEWKQKCTRATMDAHRAQRALATAREDGANIILRNKYLPQMVEDIASKLAHAWGPKINEVAQQLARTHRDYKPWAIDLSAKIDDVVRHDTIKGTIPELRYHMEIARF